MIKFESGIYFNKNWDETIGTYNQAAVPTKENALEIAKIIFSTIKINKQIESYVPTSIFYDEKDEIWIVTFRQKSDDSTLGGDCSIAIRKSDGSVIRIWFGE